MAINTENSKKTSADFTQYFDFLRNDFGLQMTREDYLFSSANRYLRILKNNFVQVELAGDQTYFHAEIRRLINGEPRPFSDRENNIGFEDLAVILTNNNYNHFDFYSVSAGWTNVLKNTAELFKKSKDVFTSDDWVDTKRIEALKNEDFFKTFGFRPNENKIKPTFFQLVKRHAVKLLVKGYKLTLDSSELPPYDGDKRPEKVMFENASHKIKISQRDWRDDYTSYYIALDGREVFQLDTTKYADIETAAQVFNDQLDKLIT